MTLSAAEIESVRFHLGWGNISVAAYPYTPDGFYEVFQNVVAPNLTTSTEATSETSVAAAGTVTLTLDTVALMTPHTRVLLDVGDAMEVCVVRAVSGLTVTLACLAAHAAPFPVAVMCGVARLRHLVHSADSAWTKLQSASVRGSSGIKQLGKGEIEWFSPSAVYQGVLTQYLGVVDEISKLVRVSVNDDTRSGRGSGGNLEVY